MVDKLISILGYGEINAKTNSQLALQLNISKRTVRDLIHKARLQGNPICSSTEDYVGYYLASNENEFNRTIAQLQSRVNSIKEIIDMMEY